MLGKVSVDRTLSAQADINPVPGLTVSPIADASAVADVSAVAGASVVAVEAAAAAVVAVGESETGLPL